MKPIPLTSGIQEYRWLIRALVLLAIAALGGAVMESMSPSSPPFRGRLSWVAEMAYLLAGQSGLVALWLLVSLALIFLARKVWRHAPRVPGDRWL